MTPKEKAEELVNRYKNLYWHQTEQYLDSEEAKICALIAVDEIFFALKYNLDGATSGSVKYWQKVKQEIEKL
jgi:hypothetical protein